MKRLFAKVIYYGTHTLSIPVVWLGLATAGWILGRDTFIESLKMSGICIGVTGGFVAVMFGGLHLLDWAEQNKDES